MKEGGRRPLRRSIPRLAAGLLLLAQASLSLAELPGVAPAVMAAHSTLMAQGAASLAGGNAEAAANAFDRAVAMVHAPDAELGLVRSYLQAGHYRQALSYAAHTAGAHSDEPEGVALYVWLLFLGDQQAAAKRILDEAQAPAPADTALTPLRRRMTTGAGNVFAPVAVLPGPDASAVMKGSGVLLADGRRALAPSSAVAGRRALWVRNGLGQTRRAVVDTVFRREGLALLTLDSSLAPPDGYGGASGKSFPGSLAYYAGYAMTGQPGAQWPAMQHGFIGMPVNGSQAMSLGMDPGKGGHGGPVFNAEGALAGIALRAPNGEHVLLPVGQIGQMLGESVFPVAAPTGGPRMAIEHVYENAMRVTLQVLATR